MSTRRPFAATSRVALAAALTCSVLLTACAAPANQAAPPSTATPSPSPSSAISGPLVTVPGLSSPVSSSRSTTSSPSMTPTPMPSSTPKPTPTPEPTPEPVITAEPPQTTTPLPETTTTQPARTTAAHAPPAHVGGGRVVVIDPGHNGANGANPDIINALVPAGFGETKACNTTGTETNAGYTEHQFTWGVANDLKDLLEQAGITVIMTRQSDDGVGPCVNKRAAVGNDANADLVLSIHGDGVDSESDQGFYVMTAQRDPAGAAMASRSANLAVDMRDGLVAAGLKPSNYLGSNGLWQRDDLAGLNLSTRPTVMVESGNMRSTVDADLMSSAQGQRQFAKGYANGVLAYLGAG